MQPTANALGLGKCVNMKPTTLPVLVFSVGGMIGNFVNDYSDVVCRWLPKIFSFELLFNAFIISMF